MHVNDKIVSQHLKRGENGQQSVTYELKKQDPNSLKRSSLIYPGIPSHAFMHEAFSSGQRVRHPVISRFHCYFHHFTKWIREYKNQLQQRRSLNFCVVFFMSLDNLNCRVINAKKLLIFFVLCTISYLSNILIQHAGNFKRPGNT